MKLTRGKTDHTWNIDGTDLDIYLQPGGCLEIGQTGQHDGVREFIHIHANYGIEVLETIIELWRNTPRTQ